MAHHPRPLSSRLELACEPNAVAWARHHTTDVLRRWRLPSEVIEVARLLVSELSTNAIRHVQPPTAPPWEIRLPVGRFVLTLTYCVGRLVIEVYDHDRCPPVAKSADDNAESGRGLLLVQSLSTRWGYMYPAPTSGKVVWCELTIPPADALAQSAVRRPRQSTASAPESRL